MLRQCTPGRSGQGRLIGVSPFSKADSSRAIYFIAILFAEKSYKGPLVVKPHAINILKFHHTYSQRKLYKEK